MNDEVTGLCNGNIAKWMQLISLPMLHYYETQQNGEIYGK